MDLILPVQIFKGNCYPKHFILRKAALINCYNALLTRYKSRSYPFGFLLRRNLDASTSEEIEGEEGMKLHFNSTSYYFYVKQVIMVNCRCAVMPAAFQLKKRFVFKALLNSRLIYMCA